MNAIQAYPMTTFFLVVPSLSLVTKGCDTSLTGTFFGLPQFNKTFETRFGRTDDFQIPSSWQSAFFSASQAGEIFGLAIARGMADGIGYRKTLTGAHLLMLCFIFLFVFAKSRAMLLLSGILCGIP
jgi:MFS transporter, SP family, general alpha glucoside:H+ symporter